MTRAGLRAGPRSVRTSLNVSRYTLAEAISWREFLLNDAEIHDQATASADPDHVLRRRHRVLPRPRGTGFTIRREVERRQGSAARDGPPARELLRRQQARPRAVHPLSVQ